MGGRIQAQLWEVALDSYGYVTTDDVRRLGINIVELVKLAHRGQLDKVGHGIYRFPQLPAQQLDPYMLAVLWTGRRGVLSHASALELYELADINPDKIHLTIPLSYRPRKLAGELYTLHSGQLLDKEIRRFEGIPIVTHVVAISQGIDDRIPSYLIKQAIENARSKGLISRVEHGELLRNLGSRL